MKLDVGCGNKPRGDVNVDLFLNEKTLHVDSRKLVFINARNIPNPVKGDAHALPFRSKCFEEVSAYALIEHCNKPSKVISELFRVSNGKIVFTVPHRFDPEQKKALKIGVHKIAGFSATTLKKWLSKLGINQCWIETEYKPYPNKILRFFYLPRKMIVHCWND